ncbi:NIPA-like protein 2 [Diadema setosum]|uniref:NIPA-like protein 2 n=1 Tax=Diadema setosum TaxID=31175 RepID=UPI003B3AF69C
MSVTSPATESHGSTSDPPGSNLGISTPLVPSSLVLGVCLAIGGNLLISISMNIQKYALTKIHERRASQGLDPLQHSEYLRSWIWWLGIGLMILGEGGNFLAYGFGPASVIAPLGTTTVVANAYISRCMGEKLRCQDILGTVIIVIGACMIVIFSTQDEIPLNPTGFVQRLAYWPFLVYLCLEVVLFVLLMYLRLVRGYSHVILYLLPAALLASLTVLGAKAVSTAISLAFEGNFSQFKSPVIYIMFAVVIITGVFQIRFVTKAMQAFEASVVVPVFFVFFTLSAILVGVFFYGEFYGLTIIRICMFLFGCACSFIGVFMITHGRGQPEDETGATTEMEGEEGEDQPSNKWEHRNGIKSPLVPPPTSLHRVQPGEEAYPPPVDNLSESSEASPIEMQDMSSTLRDQIKYPAMDQSIFKPQIGTERDSLLSRRQPNGKHYGAHSSASHADGVEE